MPRIHVDHVTPGAIPRERTVSVTDAHSETREIIRALVELPNATAKGFWRLWLGAVQPVR